MGQVASNISEMTLKLLQSSWGKVAGILLSTVNSFSDLFHSYTLTCYYFAPFLAWLNFPNLCSSLLCFPLFPSLTINLSKSCGCPGPSLSTLLFRYFQVISSLLGFHKAQGHEYYASKLLASMQLAWTFWFLMESSYPIIPTSEPSSESPTVPHGNLHLQRCRLVIIFKCCNYSSIT